MAAAVVNSPWRIVRWRGGDNVRRVKLERDLRIGFVRETFLVSVICEVGSVFVDYVAVTRLPFMIRSSVLRIVDLLGLVDPGERSFGAGDPAGAIVAAPEHKRLAVLEARF